MPITRSEVTFLQFNDIRAKTFVHRTETLVKGDELRKQMSTKLEDYLQRTTSIIEKDVNIISSADVTIRGTLATAVSNPCFVNLKIMIDSIIENSGYSISECIYDGDGIASSAAKSFYGILDLRERDYNLEPIIITSALSGRNIFTQGKAIVTRAQNLLNARTTSFNDSLNEIMLKLNEVTGVYDEQVSILDSCLKSVEASIIVDLERITKSMATCQKFTQV